MKRQRNLTTRLRARLSPQLRSSSDRQVARAKISVRGAQHAGRRPDGQSSSKQIRSWTAHAGALSCLLAVVALGTISSPVTGSVLDTNPPALAGAVAGSNEVTVVFSKPVAQPGATDTNNYSISGGGAIFAAAYGPASNQVVLTTSPLTSGTTYTLTVNNVQDLDGRSIPANSQVNFSYVAFVSADVGSPALAGSTVAVINGYDVTGAGRDLSGTNDQFQFNFQQRDGDFDVKVRMGALTPTDAWAKAGLMARESLAPNSRHAASLATPSVSGCFFQYRLTSTAASVNQGSFPVSYPATWLRLRRVGSVFTGFASFDSENWAQLGSINLPGMPGTIFLGLAVSSRVTNQLAVAQFREFTEIPGAPVGTVIFNSEPIGPSSRKTGLAITEIMYRPAPRPNGKNLEFIELYNSNPFFEDISGYRLLGDIDFTFPSNTVIQGGGFLVLAKHKADVEAAYGISGVLEYGRTNVTYTTNGMGGVTNITAATNVVNSLSRSGTVRLRSQIGAIFLEVPYSNNNPWPVGADGTGHSLVLARPSYGEGYPQAWGLSDALGGSPGAPDPIQSGALRAVVINEILAHTEPGSELVDYIELYNHSTRTNDLSGCILTDHPVTNKFVIPAGTRIPPGGFIAFDETQMGFRLDAAGETIYFKAPDARVIDAVQFEAQADGVASGRYPDGAKEFYPQTARTPGAANAGLLISDIVINEIMYKPISGDNNDEYVELYNKGANAVNLGGWKFTAGINFTFPPDRVLAAGAYLVVAENITNLLAKYPNLNSTNTVGSYSGSLANRGERLALARPEPVTATTAMGQLVTNTVYVVVDEVTYGTGGRWGNWANEGGSSLELIDPNSDHRLAYNWADSDETAKAPWTIIEHTGVLDHGAGTANYIEFLALGEGEWLMDNVEVFVAPSGANLVPNPNFESGLGNWGLRGTHIRSSLETTGGFSAPNCLHIRASARGDSVANRVLAQLSGSLTLNQTATIRARVRWLCGWPEALLRLHGNWLEATGRLNIPQNLGTPGARNSRAAANAGPAIYEVRHDPVLPATNQPVVISARASDLDGVSAVTLNFRIDPSLTLTSVPMNDAGTNGDLVADDGIFSARIDGRPAGNTAIFYLTATDALGAMTRFPDERIGREIPIRFGDPVTTTSFGTYRLWLTQTNVNAWANRPALSNERIDGTFVYGSFRAIYNVGTKYSGSPYHQGFGNPTNNQCHYSMDLPRDDLLLGTENFNKCHAPGNGPWDDASCQREQICYWMVRQLNLPWNYRRSVNFIVNGNRRQPAALMEDSQTPGNDVVEEYFPDDADGQLYKLQPWFEVDDGTGPTLNFANQSWCVLTRYVTTGGAHKLARYRQSYLTRAADGTANNYTNVFELVDAASKTNNQILHVEALEAIVDMDQWLRIFAIEHAVGNWDSFGNRNSQNMYGYKPERGRWQLLIWDYNIVLGNSGSDGPGSQLFQYQTADIPMSFIYNNPVFRRAYWAAFKDIIRGPMRGPEANAVLDAKYAAFQANGLTGIQSPNDVKIWIGQARDSISNQLFRVDARNWSVSTPTSFVTDSNLVVVSGQAPVDVRKLVVTYNGVVYPITWNNLTSWVARVVVHAGTNQISVQGFDRLGAALSNTTTTIQVTYTGVEPDPVGAVVFNEIMYRPSVTNASYVELFNSSSTASFDLSSWRVDGLNFVFPAGTVLGPHSFLTLARSTAAYATAYRGSGPVFAEFSSPLNPDGQTLALVKPGTTATQDVVVDKVRYESGAPWPTLPSNQAIALQLIDSTVDNARPSAWSDGAGWRFVSVTGSLQTNSTNIMIWMLQAGDVYLDDLRLVAGTNAGVGSNLLQNGDFEVPLEPYWEVSTNLLDSQITTEFVYSGQSSLHLVTSSPGNQSRNLRQVIPPPDTNTLYTLSYWYRTSLNGTNLVVRAFPGSGLNATITIRPIGATPGAINSAAGSLPPYPPLWLNEVQPLNVSGPSDRFGHRSPWIELHNPGASLLPLEEFYLANNYTNLTQWKFPPGASIAPGQFIVVWADGQPGLSDADEWHTSFTLGPASGAVALARLLGPDVQVMDYLNYSGLTPDQSYGNYPDGQPFDRRVFHTGTPGSTNIAPPVQLYINEWVAGNVPGVNGYPDPADGRYDDWIELYNPGPAAADLSGYYLTDNLANKTLWRIPSGTILPAGGYQLIWADNELNQNGGTNVDLHAGFRLERSGEAIGLYAVSGTNLVEIDAVTFGAQFSNISQGRFPDGAPALQYIATPTPRGPNVQGNTPPRLAPITDKTIPEMRVFNWPVEVVDPDEPSPSLTFSLGPDAPAGAQISPSGLLRWIPAETQGPGVYTITVTVTDHGTPSLSDSRSFRLTVMEQNRPPSFVDTRDKWIAAGQGLTFSTAADGDVPRQNLVFGMDAGMAAGAALDPAGLFSWRPPETQPPGLYLVTVQAQDDGTPPLSASFTYAIHVLPANAVVMVLKENRLGQQLQILWGATPGKAYRVEYREEFGNSPWVPLIERIVATSDTLLITEELGPGTQRFYRVVQLD